MAGLTSNMASTGVPQPRDYAAPLQSPVTVDQYARRVSEVSGFVRNSYTANFVTVNKNTTLEVPMAGNALAINLVTYDENGTYTAPVTPFLIAFDDNPSWISLDAPTSGAGSGGNAYMIRGISFYKIRIRNNSVNDSGFQLITFQNPAASIEWMVK